MTLQEFLDGIGMTQTTFWAIIAFLSSLFVEWRPEIKWNPWSSLFKWIGSKFNSKIDAKMDEVRREIKELDKKIENVQDELSKHIEESEIKSLQDTRRDILSFCNSCMNDRRHTKEQFTFVIKQCDEYEKYIENNNLKNGEITDAINEIRRLHQKCIRENSFLKEGEEQ